MTLLQPTSILIGLLAILKLLTRLTATAPNKALGVEEEMNRDGPAISERSTSLNYSAGTILRNKDAKQVLIGLGFPEKRA